MGRSWFCGTPMVCDVPNLFSWSGTHSSFLWAGLAGCSAHNLFSEAGTYAASPLLVHTLGPVFLQPGIYAGPVSSEPGTCIRVYAGPVFCSQQGWWTVVGGRDTTLKYAKGATRLGPGGRHTTMKAHYYHQQ